MNTMPWAQYAPNPKQRTRPKSHPQVEFHVQPYQSKTKVFRTWNEAAGFAVEMAFSKGTTTIDVVIFTEAGARWWMGEDGVEQYREDPEASVFNRYTVEASDWGRVS